MPLTEIFYKLLKTTMKIKNSNEYSTTRFKTKLNVRIVQDKVKTRKIEFKITNHFADLHVLSTKRKRKKDACRGGRLIAALDRTLHKTLQAFK